MDIEVVPAKKAKYVMEAKVSSSNENENSLIELDNFLSCSKNLLEEKKNFDDLNLQQEKSNNEDSKTTLEDLILNGATNEINYEKSKLSNSIIVIDDDDEFVTKSTEVSKLDKFQSNISSSSTNLTKSSNASLTELSSPLKILNKELKTLKTEPLQQKSRSNEKQKYQKDLSISTLYCVTPDDTASQLFEQIIYYKKKYEKQFKKFNKQIWDHLMTNLQNDKTFTWKMRVRYFLHQHISQLYPMSNLIAVGSTINGCGAFNSDMDLCLCVQEGQHFSTDRNYAIRLLRKLQKHMCSLPFVKNSIAIPAKVPILKVWFYRPYEALEVDLNINNIAGIYNSYLLHYYSRIDDRFPALSLIVKHWAKREDIGNASQGTLNSYSLILMVLHYLQVASDPPILPNLQKLYPKFFAYNMPLTNMTLFGELPTPLPQISENHKTIGELLIGFFNYYSNFDFENYAISISRGCIFPRYELPESTHRYKIYIEEPFDQQNTARCVFDDENWYKICAAFLKARDLFLSQKAGPPSINLLNLF